VEDGTFCPEEELAGAKPLRLLVGQVPAGEESIPEALRLEGQRGVGAWILDVCLDYFACGNPFLNQVRPAIAAPFAAVHNAATFRQGPVVDVPACLAQRDAFDSAYSALLRETMVCAQRPDDVEADEPEAGALLGEFLPEAQREDLIENLEEALSTARLSELQQILEAGDMVTLPLHPVTADEVEDRLAAFEIFLRRLCGCEAGGLGSPPAVVTIARSVVDGFCPMRWHCALERGVLDALHRCLGPLDITYSDELDALEAC